MVTTPPRGPRLSLGKGLTFAIIVAVATYAIVEAGVSFYVWRWPWWNSTLWIFEDSGKTYHFDSIRGYRLTSIPSRFARITFGVTEYVGSARGNSEGFPDADNFGPTQQWPCVPRIAVFGDSMTAGQYLVQNWPDRAEALARQQGTPIQFLNFAVDGGGLRNWWSILLNIVRAENYDLDGMVLAVYVDDLERGFTVSDHRAYRHATLGEAPLDPERRPRTLDDARSYLTELKDSYILSAAEFEETLGGKWPASIPRPGFRPIFFDRAWGLVRPFASYASSKIEWDIPYVGAPAAPVQVNRDPRINPWPDVPWTDFNPEQKKIFDDFRRFLEERSLPAMVAYIPDRSHLLMKPGSVPKWPLQQSTAFAKAIGAFFLHAGDVFAPMNPREIKAHFHPYDAHWNLAGSNLFAEFILTNVRRLLLPGPSGSIEQLGCR